MRTTPSAIQPAPGAFQTNTNLPPNSVCNEIVDLYFDLIDEKQLLLFHRHTFITAQRAGHIPNFLVLGMIALMAR